MPTAVPKTYSIRNGILAALPCEEFARLFPNLRPVNLTAGEVLYETGDNIRYAYFLNSGAVCLLAESSNGESIEVASVGNEGVVGVPTILRVERALFRVIVEIPGDALRVEAETLREEFHRGGTLQNWLLRYTDIDADSCDKISQELGCFILANMRAGKKGSLFPADPFIHQTNSLSLGFGACGVLYTLKKCGFEIPKCAYDWLEQELDNVTSENLPPGLLTGASGIAWSMGELGFEDRAAEFMKMANQSALLKRHHSYLYGMAGVGMANLYLYVRTKRD